MLSSNADPVAAEVDEIVAEAEAAEPAPAQLIMLEPADDAGVCAVDGWCD